MLAVRTPTHGPHPPREAHDGAGPSNGFWAWSPGQDPVFVGATEESQPTPSRWAAEQPLQGGPGGRGDADRGPKVTGA